MRGHTAQPIRTGPEARSQARERLALALYDAGYPTDEATHRMQSLVTRQALVDPGFENPPMDAQAMQFWRLGGHRRTKAGLLTGRNRGCATDTECPHQEALPHLDEAGTAALGSLFTNDEEWATRMAATARLAVALHAAGVPEHEVIVRLSALLPKESTDDGDAGAEDTGASEADHPRCL